MAVVDMFNDEVERPKERLMVEANATGDGARFMDDNDESLVLSARIGFRVDLGVGDTNAAV